MMGRKGGYRYGHTNGYIPCDPVTFPTIANYRTCLFIVKGILPPDYEYFDSDMGHRMSSGKSTIHLEGFNLGLFWRWVGEAKPSVL